MYVIIQAYVTTMAATAITMSRSVASMGDIAFLDFNIFCFGIVFHPLLFRKSNDYLFNLYELEINIPN